MNPVVYIVDDDEGLRTSLSWLLGSAGLESTAFGSAAEFLVAFDSDRPACLVLDVRMPEIGGFEVQQTLSKHHGHMPIIFVSGHGDIPMSVRAMKQGAFDFMEKPYNSQVMLERIQEAVRMATVQFDRSQKRKSLERRLEMLSPREREVLDKVVQGKPSKLIAQELNIAVKTVDIHRTNLREKLGSSSLTELVNEMLTHFAKPT